MPEPDGAALDAASRARVTLIVGAGDTGKTTLAAGLAAALARRGERVAVVDADVGQSEVGPPTTVGLGKVAGPLARLGDAEVLALEFIGDTSPVRYIRETADAAGRLVRRALAGGFQRVIVDTGGLVAGGLGLALKRAKARAVDPDLVLVVGRRDESDVLARALERGARPTVVRLAASPAVTRRSQERRRQHRDAALRAYMQAAVVLEIGLDRVDVRDPRGAPPPHVTPDMLVGVVDADGEVLGIGRVCEVDPERERLTIETPVAAGRVVRLRPGRATWRKE